MTRKSTRRPARQGRKPPSHASGIPLDDFGRETIRLFVRALIRGGYSATDMMQAIRAEVRANPPSVRPTGSGGRKDFDDPAHILTLWSKDPDYLEPNGSLRPIPARGPAPSIEALVARLKPPPTFEDAWAQLERTSTLEQVGERYVPRREAIIHLADPRQLSTHNLRVLHAALMTLEHNFTSGLSEPWYERSAQQTAFPVHAVPAFFEQVIERGMAFLQGVDSRALQIANSASPVDPLCRVLIHLFCTALPIEHAGTLTRDGGT